MDIDKLREEIEYDEGNVQKIEFIQCTYFCKIMKLL